MPKENSISLSFDSSIVHCHWRAFAILSLSFFTFTIFSFSIFSCDGKMTVFRPRPTQTHPQQLLASCCSKRMNTRRGQTKIIDVNTATPNIKQHKTPANRPPFLPFPFPLSSLPFPFLPPDFAPFYPGVCKAFSKT